MVTVAAAVLSAFSTTQAPASFPGGEKACTEFINKNVVYPATAAENGVEGVVTLTFTVKTDGTIGNIKVKRMIDPDLEAEAIRVVKKMPKWQPALQDGTAVESTATLNFPFRLK